MISRSETGSKTWQESWYPMVKVVVTGGGWSGCAAAVQAAKQGAQVTLLERTDMLLGTGLVGGIIRNNGRYTAAEELIALGGKELITICDRAARHTNIDFPGHKHASLYDVALAHGEVFRYLINLGVRIIFESRIIKVRMRNNIILSAIDQMGQEYEGDVFLDTTGTAGPMQNCGKYGNGCSMCILRCPSFGGRVSLAGLAGVKEITGKRNDGTLGAMSGSCKLLKESLSKGIQEELNRNGVAVVPIPEELREDHLGLKACQQYARSEFRDKIILLDTGHAKMMTPYYKLEKLRKIPGFENARYEDPYAGGKGNSMRFFNMAPRDNTMKVQGVGNLFCAGEKSGMMIGHTEAMVTGTLAGYNSVRYALGKPLLELPVTLACGDAIEYVRNAMETEEGLLYKYTFSGSVYFERMKSLRLYTTDISEIEGKVSRAGMREIFDA